MQQIQQIPVSKIEYSATNPRKTIDASKLRELADSMIAIGLISPIKVRPRGKGYELVAGERRVRAAELAHWPEIDAIVEDMEDVQVLEVQLVENAQREEVHPIEEAEIFLALHRDHAYPVAKLAEKCGKSISHVHSRLKIATSLGERGKTACRAGQILPTVADLIARLDPKLQDEALDLATGGHEAAAPTHRQRLDHETALNKLGIRSEKLQEDEADIEGTFQPLSFRAFQKIYRAKFATRLDEAPFNVLDDQLAPEVGACTTCPSNSGIALDLFPDFPKEDGVCVNTACFGMKVARTYELAQIAATNRGLKVLDDKANEKLAKQRERGGGDFVAPDAAVPADLLPPGSKPLTWGKLLGAKHDVPFALAKDERGAPVELLDKRKATELLRERGKLDEKPAKATTPKASPEEQAKAAEKERVASEKLAAKKAIRAAAFGRTLGELETKVSDVDAGHRKLTAIVRLLVMHIVEGCGYQAQQLVVERRDLGSTRDAQEQLGELAESERKLGGLLALAIELVAAEDAAAVIGNEPWQKERREAFAAVCEAVGVSFEKQLELAEKAAEVEAKSEAAKAKKDGAK